MGIPGMDSYLETSAVEIPSDETENTGEGDDISKEVDADGEPLSDEDQKRARTDPWDLPDPGLMKAMFPVSSVEEYSNAWKDSGPEQPYCPVYAEKTQDGGRKFTAYVTGAINDVDDYVDLIDTLLTARENDSYTIYIDSPGGMIAAGGIISSAIHHSRADVRTQACGICASAGALIHSSAKKEKATCTPFALMMYHMSSHWDGGYSTKVMERAQNQIRYVNECLLNKALDDGHITQDDFEQIQNGKDIFVPATKFSRCIADDTETAPGMESFRHDLGREISSIVANAKAVPMWPEEMSTGEIKERMASANTANGKRSALMIRTGDKKSYRVYIHAQGWFTQNYINGICRFLDSRKEGETVTFVLGVKLCDWQSHLVGAIISAMQRCKATVNTVAAGYCSIVETMIWCFGQNRDVYRYGALSFGVSDLLKSCKEYRFYFEYFLQKAVSIGMLTEEDVQHIWDTTSEKLLLYSDYKALEKD